MASTPSEEETSADSSVTETGNVLRDQTCELGKEPVEPPREEDRADDGDQGAPPANNPTRDALAEGLVGLLRPSLETLDSSVLSARQAQLELKERIEGLERLLNRLEAKEQRCPVDLEGYIVKLQSTKQRINVINNILQAAQVNFFVVLSSIPANLLHNFKLSIDIRRRRHLALSKK